MVAKNAKRLGVGATPPAISTAAAHQDAFVAADWTKTGKKKILSIGKKHNPHDDDEDAIDRSKREDDNPSSEEEEGRTSAVKERKRKMMNVPIDVTSDCDKNNAMEVVAPKIKEKKKGKKERDQENHAATVGDATDDKVNQSTNEGNYVQENDQIEPSTNNEHEENKKYKRKKTRSRQKNIRKDKRSIEEKPAHLVLGNSDYTGRPLTKATKEKLVLNTQAKDCLPTTPLLSKTESSSTDKLLERVKESTLEQSTVDEDLSSELAMIGDCVVGDVVERSKDGTNPGSTKKKKPKRKFKNC
ncbi:hypothetical protein HJC23_005947 [Cyclotella cryptica]|uniref:Uncharacterized protein n=1 Tax=Cyclotella cryptica TaxID=29204 RepID=A0ABD3QZQ4_9STRA|eukprot:CCRYP_000508-RA/>CCRYP_000508-RA protein AED:0.01 eAED:0.01 QI:125/-1/1/1/-1/1/1/434/299